MTDRRDLELVLQSGVAIVAIETTDEERFLGLLKEVALASPSAQYRPLFRWTVTDGLQRLDLALEPQRHNAAPTDVLRHIRATQKPGLYALLDFHPFLADPVNVRLLKDIALDAPRTRVCVLLISHELGLPAELKGMSAQFAMRLPDGAGRRAIIRRLIDDYREEHPRRALAVDEKALELLVQNLGGLTHADVERLARNVIFDDGALREEDLPAAMRAKYDLLNRGGVLSYEYDTAKFSDVAGFRNVKTWLTQRRTAFSPSRPAGLDVPKGILLIGVQGCGKSLAAKAAASILGAPLLRLDFGALYNKYHGETERNLRESLHTAELMSPCVLWLDEIEKGIAGGNDETGTSRRVLGTLLTWMAERKAPVLLVATANAVGELPPELIRKGRFDEIFFVDLPQAPQRAEILAIHLRKRGLDPAQFELPAIVAATDGFSGAELEQSVVSALYAAHALGQQATATHLVRECRRTRPLSVLMHERVAALREWARDRTVTAD